MKILINIFTHSLGEPLCLAVELDRAPLGHGHVAAALLVVNAGRDDHLQVRHLALHGGRVHLGGTILVAMSLVITCYDMITSMKCSSILLYYSI